MPIHDHVGEPRRFRVGQATRFDRESCDPASQASRIIEEGSRLWCALTNSGDSGFSSYQPELVERALTIVERMIATSTGSAAAIATRVVEVLNADFAAQTNAMTDDERDVAGGPHGNLLLAAIEDNARLFVTWVGSGEIRVLRGGKVIARTRAHSMISELIARHELREDEAAHFGNSDVCIRTLMGEPTVAGHAGPFALARGDVVALFDGIRIPFDASPTSVGLLTRAAPPSERALDLVRLAMGNRAAAVVIDIDA
ncbi:MAG: hypothetical protein ACHREM_19465 [Polyangiales bacterium]